MLLLLIASLLLALPPSEGAKPFAPHIERVDCARFASVAEGTVAECGYLRVREDRADPASRIIGVPFAVVRSPARTADDPVVFFTGGPGNRGIPRTLRSGGADGGRDRVYFEQRGTALADPALECPGYAEEKQRASRGEIDGEALARGRIAVAKRCADHARKAGVALSGYTTTAVVHDLEDFRGLMGFERLNLVGLSYSGKVVSQYARDFPARTRAVVANTPLSLEADYDEFGSSAMRRTLDLLFESCAADPACGAAHPDVDGKFRTIVKNAARDPWILQLPDPDRPGQQATVRATPWVVANALLDQLYSPDTFESLPARLDALAAGDRQALVDILDIGKSSQSWLMRIAVWCNEEAPFEDEAATRRETSAYPEFGGVDQSTVPPGLCRAAGFTAAPDPRDNAPVSSDVPFLIFSGRFDPATPPAVQATMARTLSRATVVTFPAAGHGAGFSPCGAKLVAAFLRDPTAAVDASCAGEKPAPEFSGSLQAGG